MIYRYDKNVLDFKKLSTGKIMFAIVFAIIAASFVSHRVGLQQGLQTNLNDLSIEDRYHLIHSTEKDTFSQAKLAEMLQDLNVRFPHIVMAQAIIESGHFQSNIFRSNRNLFGMKQARARCTTARGTELNHAFYDNWRESVYDYAFFQSRYLNDLRTEEQYLEYLDKNYAEAPEYDKAILKVIENNNLREMFSK